MQVSLNRRNNSGSAKAVWFGNEYFNIHPDHWFYANIGAWDISHEWRWTSLLLGMRDAGHTAIINDRRMGYKVLNPERVNLDVWLLGYILGQGWSASNALAKAAAFGARFSARFDTDGFYDPYASQDAWSYNARQYYDRVMRGQRMTDASGVLPIFMP